jgi:hypothetical protein
MASRFEYDVVPTPQFDVFKKPIAIPGEIQSRDYAIYRPTANVVGLSQANLSTISWTISNPSLYADLYESFIAIKASLNVPSNDAVSAFVYNPQFFRQAQLMIGATSVESSSSLLPISAYVDTHLKYSAAAKASLGQMEGVGFDYGLGVRPVSSVVYPPADNGVGADGSPIISGTIAGGDTPTNAQLVAGISGSTPDPKFNPAFAYSNQQVRGSIVDPTDPAFVPGSVTFYIPLSRLLAYVQPGMPVHFGQTFQLTLQANAMGSLYYSGADRNVVIQDMTLWLHNVKPSAAVAARLLQDVAEKRTTLYQFMARDSLNFPAGLQQSFTQSFSIPVSNPQWLVVTFRPETWGATRNSPLAVSFPPNPISIAGAFPFSSAYVTAGGKIVPGTTYGSAASDLVRAYKAYLECCGQTAFDGPGPAISYEQFLRNHFFLCFYLGNRSIEEGPAGSMSGSITLNLSLNAAPTTNNYAVSVTYYGVRGAELQAISQGVQVLNVS